MSLIDISQWAGMALIGLYFPLQNWRLILTRNPLGISFLAFAFLMAGIAGYISLALHLGLVGLAAGNISNFIFTALILFLVWKRSSALSKKEQLAGFIILALAVLFLTAINTVGRQNAVALSGIMGAAGIVAFYPVQNFDLLRKRDPAGLSLMAFIFLAVGLFFYTLLGFLVDDTTIIIGNGFSLVGSLIAIGIILRYRHKPAPALPRVKHRSAAHS